MRFGARSRTLVPLGAVVALLVTFAIASWTAARTKGPTYDETLHAPASILHLRLGDFRVGAERPPLTGYWAALPSLARPLPEMNLGVDAFRHATADDVRRWTWSRQTMYMTPGNSPDAILFRGRAMMLALAVAVGAFACAWSWRLAGPIAAVITATLFAFDPNLLAHAPLVGDDVATSGAIALVAWATWRVGRRLTVGRAIALGVACGIAIVTSFAGLLVLPIVAALLVGRAIAPTPWPAGRRALDTRARRLLAVAALGATVVTISYGTLWATYRFRYDATPAGELHYELPRLANEVTIERAKAVEHVALTPDEAAARPPDLPCRVVLRLAAWRAAPEAYLGGLLHAYAQSIYRVTYLFGHAGEGGVWYYFPVAIAVKEPLTTLVVVAFAAIVGARRALRRRDAALLDAWSWACLLVPPAVVLAAATSANVNVGVRHVFPIFPFAFIAGGVLLAPLLRRFDETRVTIAAALAMALAAESFSAWPNYLPFFNVAAGGPRGGFRLLGDSNLDWGQEMPAIVAWQRANPTRTLTLAYFGSDSARSRGLRYTALIEDGDNGGRPPGFPTHGVLAVSATMLQIHWEDANVARYFAAVRQLSPTEVLNGTIYLYDLGGR